MSKSTARWSLTAGAKKIARHVLAGVPGIPDDRRRITQAVG
jgi:hypothetical protein